MPVSEFWVMPLETESEQEFSGKKPKPPRISNGPCHNSNIYTNIVHIYAEVTSEIWSKN